MFQVLRTPEAYHDLQAIWVYLAIEAGEAIADRVLDQIDARLRLLSEFPEMGRQRPEFGHTVRSHPSGSYTIFYRPAENAIEVLRVLHGARDIQYL